MQVLKIKKESFSLMTNCTKFPIHFPSIKNKKVVANFKGGDVTSDAGVLLLRKVDKKLKLTQNMAKHFVDPRDPNRITHMMLEMLQQRVYGIACGYEDLNDHNSLKNDTAFQTAVGKEGALASSPTLCRFENSFNRETAVNIHKEILNAFVSSYSAPPKELILDFDPTDIPIHGNQEGKAYHGYYGHECFLPLHVFCGDKLLVSYLRKSNQDSAKHGWAILALLVKFLRKKWPKVQIIFRADGAFSREKILRWCDKNQVKYVVGIACNSRIKKALHPYVEKAKAQFLETKENQQIFQQFAYRAYSWAEPRKLIGKAEYTSKGENTRGILTNIEGSAEDLYKKKYCARGDMENRIQEQFLLFSDRTSCHKWWSNQLRILISAIAYVLVEHLRSSYLQGTEFAKCKVKTIRLKLFKIGAVITKNTRKIMFFMSSHYPHQNILQKIVNLMDTS